MKKILLTFLLTIPFLLHAQTEKIICINPDDTATLMLSQIAEKVTPIPLSSSVDCYYVYLTDEYLYTANFTSISQFDISGKHIKTINFKEFINGITGDISKKEIYISVGNKVTSYDYSLKEIKSYKTKDTVSSLFFYNNNLYVYSYAYNGEGEITHYYKISTLDLVSGKESFIFENNNEFIRILKKIVANAKFSIYNDQVVFSNKIDSTLYGIKGSKVYPIIKYKVSDMDNMSHEFHPDVEQGFMGKYLLINYGMKEEYGGIREFCYLEDTKTEKRYSKLIDDIYSTGKCNIKLNLNLNGYFYYVKKDKKDLSKVSDSLKILDGPVIFIVKAKQ